MNPVIDRGALITEDAEQNGYMRYKDTETGISPRAVPGTKGFVHVVATDEHDENSSLLSDEFTNPHKRRKMVEKRARKFDNIEKAIEAPVLEGPADAEVTIVGWGSTEGVIREAIATLKERGVTANQIAVKWMVPLHGEAITNVVNKAKRTIVVENNFSGQFYRYLRSETGLTINNHIRKYDGEPFMPHHIADGVQEILAGKVDTYVPYQEVNV
jgi:2-oxoglutarate ferredoxin oxidoreductase subunit alpha